MKHPRGDAVPVVQRRPEPLTYAERLHRLTLKKVLEKAEGMAAELAEDRERSAGTEGQGPQHKRQGPPARNPQPLTAATED